MINVGEERMMQFTGWICFTPTYEYKGVTFEFHRYCGPWPIKKDGEPFKRAGKKFFDVFDEWFLLPEDEQETYRIGGGCERF